MAYRKHACEAARLAKGLTDEALFVLMACEGVGKSRTLRVFSEKVLNRPSVTRPLAVKGLGVEEAVRDLLAMNLLDRPGRRRLACTSNGNLVKHAFNELKSEFTLKEPVNPLLTGTLALIPVLKERMEKACAEEWGRSKTAS